MANKKFNIRSRCFNLVLYNDNENHLKALEKIKKEQEYYAYILHDKDIDKDGNLKKPHYHVIVKFQNAHYKTPFCKDLNVEENLVECADSIKASLLYLIHWNNHDKIGYDLTEVHGPMFSSLQKYLQAENEVEDERVMSIYELIYSCKYILKYSELFRLICDNGLYSDYRRGYSIIKDIIEEHNSQYCFTQDRLPK